MHIFNRKFLFLRITHLKYNIHIILNSNFEENKLMQDMQKIHNIKKIF